MKLLVVICATLLSVVSADLKLSGIKCGVLTCDLHQYCSPFDNRCLPCSDICNKSNHNNDERTCVDNCQDYLHDVRYLRSGNNIVGGGGIDSAADIKTLYKLTYIALTLVILLILVLLAILAVRIYFWVKKNDVTIGTIKNHFSKNSEDEENKVPPNNGINANGKRDLRIDIPPPSNHSELSPVTMTTSISRRPAEDSALDYAYDNPAMSATPSPPSAKPTRESNF